MYMYTPIVVIANIYNTYIYIYRHICISFSVVVAKHIYDQYIQRHFILLFVNAKIANAINKLIKLKCAIH